MMLQLLYNPDYKAKLEMCIQKSLIKIYLDCPPHCQQNFKAIQSVSPSKKMLLLQLCCFSCGRCHCIINNQFLTICNTFSYYYDYINSTVSSTLNSGCNSSLKHFQLLMLIRGSDGSEFLKSESHNISFQYFIFVNSFIFINFVSPTQLMSLEQGPWKDFYLPWISGYSSVK